MVKSDKIAILHSLIVSIWNVHDMDITITSTG